MAQIQIESRPWRRQLPIWADGSAKAWRGDDGVLFVYSAGPKAVLAVIGPMGSNAGLIHLEARGIAKEIGELF
jgi:hypothetical protein